MTLANTIQTESLQTLALRFPVHTAATPGGQLQFRQSGNAAIAPTHVLLHGIGSGSASWVLQLQAAQDAENLHVLAWDAPGYAASTAVGPQHPQAADYAQVLWLWLDALQASQPVTQPIKLVGHSLGCLMAAAAIRLAPQRVGQLFLLAPAQGYARASAPDREQKRKDRLDNLAHLGPQGMAQKRGAAMLSPSATPEQIALVQSVMAQINPAGYTQAVHLLMDGDIRADLQAVACPVVVASGSADTVTPPAGCQALATAIGAPYFSLPDAGHVCALQSAAQVNALIGLVTSGPSA